MLQQGACAGEDHWLAKEMLDTAYKQFANTAELEVAAVTDAEVLRNGLRAMPPQRPTG